MDVARAVTPPNEEKPLPATPSRPSLNSMVSSAEVEALLPPGQPRKTPTAKRVALEMMAETEDDSEAESDESVLGVKYGKTKTDNRGRVPAAKQLRSATPNGKTTIKTTTAVAASPIKAAPTRTAPASERPIRVTRATTRSTAAATRKPLAPAQPKPHPLAPIAAIPAHRPRGPTGAAPPAQPQTTQKVTRATATPSSRIPARRHTRATSPPLPPPPSSSGSTIPTYSRLPPLVPTKRRYVLKAPPQLPSQGQANTNVAPSLETVPEQSPDAWMSGLDAQAVVEPATKSGRPSIRSVRKRRSSFSAADLL